jgi:hypothetical protein
MTEEDEAFNEIERQAKQRKEAVRATMQTWKSCVMTTSAAFGMQKPQSATRIMEGALRNGVVEEVAQHIEKLKGFGQDTVSSLAIYIREMKK